jgi:hypothetical protein
MSLRTSIVGFFASTLCIATAVANTFSDPTQPVDFVQRTVVRGGASAAVPTGPVLQSTMVSPQRKWAYINGKCVKIGDTFEGATITDITSYEVRMNRGGRETSLRLLPKLTKEKGAVE